MSGSILEEVISIAETGDYINGIGFKESDWDGSGLPIIRIQNLTNQDKPFNFTSREVDEKFHIKDGDILVSWSATLDAFIWRRGPALLNQHIFKVVPRTGFVNPRFLYYQLKHIIASMSRGEHAHGSTMKHINRKPFLAHPFWRPPLEHQEVIGQMLDKLFSDLDDTERTLKSIQSKLKQARASILKAAVEGRLIPPARKTVSDNSGLQDTAVTLLKQIEKSTEDFTGQRTRRLKEKLSGCDNVHLPDGWCLARLSELGVFGRGKSRHRPRNDPRLFGGSYPFIQTGEVACSKGRIDGYSCTYSEFGLAQSKLWPRQTLCITIAANIANTGILQMDACFPDSVVGLYCPMDANVVKYAELFIGSIKDRLEELAPATAQKNINLKILDDLGVPIPPLRVLRQIVSEVDRRFTILEQVEATVKANLDRCTKLRQAILRRAFEGRLVTAS